MQKLSIAKLTPPEQTAFITLGAHALDARAAQPILNDQKSIEILDSIDLDAKKFESGSSEKFNMKERFNVGIRGKYLDDWITRYITEHDNALVVDLGCGLDNRAYRIELPTGVDWFNVDFSEVMALREHFYPASGNIHNVVVRPNDDGWLSQLPQGRPAIFVADGFFPFVTTEFFSKLLNTITATFKTGEFVMNGYTKLSASALPHLAVMKNIGVKTYSGFNSPHQVEQWAPGMRFAEQKRLVDSEYVERMPFGYRLQCKITRHLPGLDAIDIGVLRYTF